MKKLAIILLVVLGTFMASAYTVSTQPAIEDGQYMLIFRGPTSMKDYQPSQEEMQASIQQWGQWIGGIASQGKLVSTHEIGFEGSIIKSDGSVEDSFYSSEDLMVGGYMILKASSKEEALKLAKGCPVLSYGGSVEVRNLKPNEH
jgi:hypothetical protein